MFDDDVGGIISFEMLFSFPSFAKLFANLVSIPTITKRGEQQKNRADLQCLLEKLRIRNQPIPCILAHTYTSTVSTSTAHHDRPLPRQPPQHPQQHPRLSLSQPLPYPPASS